MRLLPKATNTCSRQASTAKAIVAYRIGRRDSAVTDDFIQDLRGRVLGAPEISTDGWHPYKPSIRDAVTDLRKMRLFAGRDNSGGARGRSGYAGRNLNLLCRAQLSSAATS